MCGIAGIFNCNYKFNREELKQSLIEMTDQVIHRGPDDYGYWISNDLRCGLGHRRLSIIDLSYNGKQPMKNDRYVITFNGEIYNYKDLKRELQQLGVEFKTQTDTEVLLEAYTRWGKDCLIKFDGMFAFAIYDKQLKQLFLARDAFGEKPLYYSYLNGSIVFGSELKQISGLPHFNSSTDANLIAEYLCLQYIDQDRTIFKNAYKLKPGHYIEFKSDAPKEQIQFFSFEPKDNEAEPVLINDLADELEDLLIKSLKRRLIADVPLGAFLSGGVDSSLVVALITKKLNIPVKTFSIGFENSDKSEHMYARQMASHFSTEHYEKLLPTNDLPEVSKIGSFIDDLNADTSLLPTYKLCEFAKKNVTVAISGDGADELFGGYSRYQRALTESRSNPLEIGKKYYSKEILIFNENEAIHALDYPSDDFKNHLQELRKELVTNSIYSAVRKTDTDHYMPGAVLAKVDRMSMAHALEVRTPFLNVEISRFCEKLPNSMLFDSSRGKILLKHLASRYIPKNCLERSKSGFGAQINEEARKKLLMETQEFFKDQETNLILKSIFKSSFLENAGLKKLGYKNLWALNLLFSYIKHNPFHFPILVQSELQIEILQYCIQSQNSKVIITNDYAPDWYSQIPSISDIFCLGHSGHIDPKIHTVDLSFFNGSSQLESALNQYNIQKASLILLCPLPYQISILSTHLVSEVEEIMIVESNKLCKWKEEKQTGKGKGAIHINPHKRKANHALLFDHQKQELKSFGNKWTQLKKAFRHDFSINLSQKEKRENLFFCKYTLFRKDTPQRSIRLIYELYLHSRFKKSEHRWFKQLFSEINASKKHKVSSTPKKVLLVIDTLVMGGAERQIINLAKYLKRAKLDVKIATTLNHTSPCKSYLQKLANEGIAHINPDYSGLSINTQIKDTKQIALMAQMPKFLKHKVWFLYQVLNSFKPDVVHSFLDYSNIVTAYACFISGHPRVLISFRNQNPQNLNLGKSWYKKYYKRIAPVDSIQLTANSVSGAKDYRKWLNLSSKDIHITQNLFDFEDCNFESEEIGKIRKDLNMDLDQKVVGGVFRMTPQKEPIDFVKVINKVVLRIPNLKVILVGSGILKIKVQQKIKTLGLESHFIFLDQHPNILALYSIMDMFLLTSSYEGTPNVLVEAMANSTPVVSTDVGGVPELVKHGHNGLLAKPHDIETLASHCIKLLNSKELREKFSSAGRRLVEDEYAPEKRIDELLALYGKN